MRGKASPATIVLVLVLVAGCGDDGEPLGGGGAARIHDFADACVAVEDTATGQILSRATDTSFAFSAQATAAATPFFMKASRLGTYLLRDEMAGYLVSEGADLQRRTELLSDVLTVDDSFESPAEWELQGSETNPSRLQLRHRKSGRYLAAGGLVADAADAAAIELRSRSGCAPFPELTTDTEGEVEPRRFDDGDVFGFADIHSHLLSNFAFGGGGIFHGATFHPLGVEHALPDCSLFHGEEGRRDLFGAAFDAGADVDLGSLITAVTSGMTPDFNHATAGYPDFTGWPDGPRRSTHQTQYYKWLERAYLGGLRLVVQHAVSNQMICDFLAGGGIQPVRYSCNDMVAVDRQLDEIYAMQDYIDAQEGGPGEGWFRIVTSPAEAREVIHAGKMAVILGIETSNLFDCFLTTPDGFSACTEESVRADLDAYYERGVRVLFPVHKYDNAFSAGDGHKGFIELGNVLQTSHFSSFVPDCDPTVPSVFDRGAPVLPGLNEPREEFLAPAPNDFSDFFIDPLGVLGPILPRLLEPPDPEGQELCQSHGLTDLGEFLIREIMQRGMVLELDHFPRHSYRRAFEMLEANDYPAVGSHGLDNFGALYALGGVSKSGFSRCRKADQAGTVDDGFQARLQSIRDNGGYPGLGFGLDLNGFAGAQGPRFGNRGCSEPQSDPLTYPFTSYAGDVTFFQPRVGNRAIDFNAEGLVHIGLLPDLIEDVRRDGVGEETLEALFRSAEAYLRMWEKSEQRGEALRE